MQLFTASGTQAQPLISTTFADEGLRERDHLQEWVIAHPEVLGTGLLVITVEYDQWRAADGVASRDRLDVLALETSGRLVVAELKRDGDRDVHLQAITYAALVSRFDVSTLADAHAKFLSQRGTPTSTAEAREALLEHVEGEWDVDLLRQPAIVLVAAAFPRVVTHAAVWLSEMGLSVALVQVGLWRSAAGLVTSFERLYPVPAVEQFTLAPARQEIAQARERAEVSSRRGPTVSRLSSAGALDVGAQLRLAPYGRITAEEREAVLDLVRQDPSVGRAQWNGDPATGLMWEKDGQPWTPTGLSKHIVELATGRRPTVIGGPRWWRTEDGVSLRDLADGMEESRTGAFDWEPMHETLAALPSGTWTTYGELAKVLGTAGQPVGNHIRSCRVCPRAHRVLNDKGRVSDRFRWADPTRVDDPLDLLRADGVVVHGHVADPSQKLEAAALASLLTARSADNV